jgi:hypothetical protein
MLVLFTVTEETEEKPPPEGSIAFLIQVPSKYDPVSDQALIAYPLNYRTNMLRT